MNRSLALREVRIRQVGEGRFRLAPRRSPGTMGFPIFMFAVTYAFDLAQDAPATPLQWLSLLAGAALGIWGVWEFAKDWFEEEEVSVGPDGVRVSRLLPLLGARTQTLPRGAAAAARWLPARFGLPSAIALQGLRMCRNIREDEAAPLLAALRARE